MTQARAQICKHSPISRRNGWYKCADCGARYKIEPSHFYRYAYPDGTASDWHESRPGGKPVRLSVEYYETETEASGA